jgi:hypothetical protein
MKEDRASSSRKAFRNHKVLAPAHKIFIFICWLRLSHFIGCSRHFILLREGRPGGSKHLKEIMGTINGKRVIADPLVDMREVSI